LPFIAEPPKEASRAKCGDTQARRLASHVDLAPNKKMSGSLEGARRAAKPRPRLRGNCPFCDSQPINTTVARY